MISRRSEGAKERTLEHNRKVDNCEADRRDRDRERNAKGRERRYERRQENKRKG